MKRPALLAALVAAFAAAAAPAHAAVSSASIGASLLTGEPTATLNLDGADDDLTVSVADGLLVHDQTGGGLNSEFDWECAAVLDDPRPNDTSPLAQARSALVTPAGPVFFRHQQVGAWWFEHVEAPDAA